MLISSYSKRIVDSTPPLDLEKALTPLLKARGMVEELLPAQAALRSLGLLRANCTIGVGGQSASMEHLRRYYRHLVSFEEFEGPLHVLAESGASFCWSDTMQVGEPGIPSGSIQYEKCCVLYQMMSSEGHACFRPFPGERKEQLRDKALTCRKAWGINVFLMNEVRKMPAQTRMPFDLTEKCLTYFHYLWKAQAQSLMYLYVEEVRKEVREGSTSSAATPEASLEACLETAGFALHTATCFREVSQKAGLDEAPLGVFPWHRYAAIQARYYGACACKYKAAACEAEVRLRGEGWGEAASWWNLGRREAGAAGDILKAAMADKAAGKCRDDLGHKVIADSLAALVSEFTTRAAASEAKATVAREAFFPDWELSKAATINRRTGEPYLKEIHMDTSKFFCPIAFDATLDPDAGAAAGGAGGGGGSVVPPPNPFPRDVLPPSVLPLKPGVLEALKRECKEWVEVAGADTAACRALLTTVSTLGTPPTPGIPEPLWARVLAVQRGGGYGELERSIRLVGAEISRTRAALDGCRATLDSEAAAWEEGRGAWGAGWTQPPPASAGAFYRNVLASFEADFSSTTPIFAACAARVEGASGQLAALGGTRGQLEGYVPPPPPPDSSPETASLRASLGAEGAALGLILEGRSAIEGAWVRDFDWGGFAAAVMAGGGGGPGGGGGGEMGKGAAVEGAIARHPVKLRARESLEASAAAVARLTPLITRLRDGCKASAALSAYTGELERIGATVDLWQKCRSELVQAEEYWGTVRGNAEQCGRTVEGWLMARRVEGDELKGVLMSGMAARAAAQQRGGGMGGMGLSMGMPPPPGYAPFGVGGGGAPPPPHNPYQQQQQPYYAPPPPGGGGRPAGAPPAPLSIGVPPSTNSGAPRPPAFASYVPPPGSPYPAVRGTPPAGGGGFGGPAAAAGAGAGAGAGGASYWECKTCTYHNEAMAAHVCAICNGSR